MKILKRLLWIILIIISMVIMVILICLQPIIWLLNGKNLTNNISFIFKQKDNIDKLL